MRCLVRRMLLFTAGCLLLLPAGIRAQEGAGLAPEWDVRAMIEAVTKESQRLKPILDQVNAKEWVAQGASETYVSQLNYSQNEVQYFVQAAQKLARDPEKLSAGLETIFRMESMERFMNSLSEGIRRYQNPALADLLQGVMVENYNNRERLRKYVLDLAIAKEEEFDVMNSEAQRCRVILSQQPAAPKPAPRAPKSEERK